MGKSSSYTLNISVTDDQGYSGTGSINMVGADVPPDIPPDPPGLDDGSSGAPANGSFQQPDFFTYAAQNGQRYSTRPGWKAAGVDYKVGYSGPLKDPTVSGNLPGGAKYSNGVVQVTGNDVTLDGFDFSVRNGVCINVAPQAGGTFTLSGSKKVGGSATAAAGDWLVVGSPGNTAGPKVVLHNNDIDLRNAAGTPLYRAIVNWGNGSFTAEYNRMKGFNRRMFFSSGAFILEYNYLEGQNYNTSDHGEWTIFNAMAASGQTCPLIKCSFNTLLQPKDYGGGQTSPLYACSGSSNQRFRINEVMIDHNTCVVNQYWAKGFIKGTTLTITADTCNQLGVAAGNVFLAATSGVLPGTKISADGSGRGSTGTYTVDKSQNVGSASSPVDIGFLVVSVGLVEIGYDTVDKVTVQDNYCDLIGVLTGKMFMDAGTANSPAALLSGNIDLISGKTIT